MGGRPVADEDVVRAIAIEIEDRNSCTRTLEDGRFLVLAAEGVENFQARLPRDIDERYCQGPGAAREHHGEHYGENHGEHCCGNEEAHATGFPCPAELVRPA